MLLEENWVGLPQDTEGLAGLRIAGLPIHVISLRRSVERRRAIERQMREQGLAFTFLDAIDGGTLPGDSRAWVSPLGRLLKGYDFTPGQIGCWLSHRMVWQKVAEVPGSVALVLEDDAILSPDFAEKLAMIEAETRGFDVVQLSYTKRPGRHFEAVKPVGAEHQAGLIHTKANGGGAYLVRTEGAAKLLSVGAMAFCNDDWGWYEALSGLNRCGVLPPLVDNPRTQSVIAEIDGEQGTLRQRRKKGLLARAHKLLLSPALSRLQQLAIALRHRPSWNGSLGRA